MNIRDGVVTFHRLAVVWGVSLPGVRKDCKGGVGGGRFCIISNITSKDKRLFVTVN